MINYVYVWLFVFSDVLIKYMFYTDIFLNTYLCMKFSMYNLTECLSVTRSLNSLNPLITGKTSYSFFDLAATCFPIPSPV